MTVVNKVKMFTWNLCRKDDPFNKTWGHAGVKGYKSPGYPQPNGTFTDLLGDIQKGEILMTGTGLLIFENRRAVVKYLGLCYYFRNNMVYLSTNSFSTPTALIEPFSFEIWMVFLLYLIVSIVLITVVFLYERRFRKYPLEISASKSSLIVLGSLTGQGEPMNLSTTSSYALLLVMLVSSFLLYCGYSAVIVRFLLAEPSPNFSTLDDFLRSPLKIAALDFFYYRNTVFGPNMSEMYRQIYDKKMTSPGGYKGFQTSVEGLLAGKWGVLMPEPFLYEKFKAATPQQKCRYFEVPQMPRLQNPICPMIHRDSPAIKMINRGLTLMRERGVYSRHLAIWHAPKPRCEKSGIHQWSSVSHKVLYPAFGLICGAFITSTLLLLLETVYFSWKRQEEKNYRWKFWSRKNRRVEQAKNNDATIFQVA